MDTVIYMLYKDAAVTTWQGDVNGTWNSNYLMVHHDHDGSNYERRICGRGNAVRLRLLLGIPEK